MGHREPGAGSLEFSGRTPSPSVIGTRYWAIQHFPSYMGMRDILVFTLTEHFRIHQETGTVGLDLST